MDNINLENYKTVIFDLDGVIFDITSSIKQATEDVVEKYKINVKLEDVLQEIAHLIEDLQHYPVPKLILQSYDLLKDVQFLKGLSFFKKLRIGIYLFSQFNKYKEDAGIYKGIDEIISKIHEKGIKLAILTNNKNTHAEEVLKKFDLDKYFELIIGFNEVSEVKPSPEGINLILKKWEIAPDNAIFIGDMTTDVLAGKAAKVKMICMASGLATKEALEENDPDILLENTQALKELFGF